MNQRVRTGLLLAGAVIVAIVLFVVLRPGDDESASPTTGQTTTAAATTTGTTPTAPTTTEGPPRRFVRIVYQGGRVVGGIRRVRLDRGDVLTLRVASSVSDHVHVHGYDLMRDTAPGHPAAMTFRVTAAGRFEVELEDRKVQIAELDVRP